MIRIFKFSLLLASICFGLSAKADHHEKVLFKELVTPILEAKCIGCHGADKQKGKLRLDTIEAILKGGSEGLAVVAGNVTESSLIERSLLPIDDDEHMPPEKKPQLTKEEIAVLDFWIRSGAKTDATIAQLKPSAEVDAMIKVVIANPPKGAQAAAVAKIDPAKQKAAEAAIGNVEKTGASLMAIAQDTPDLRFSALNVAREYGDKNLEVLKPVADQVKWMDLARTQVTDAGMAHVGAMKNLTRLHLENTKITDAGLDHLKNLGELEYLNLYGTLVTDAGIAKLAGLKKLKKLFVWETKVTDAGAKKISAAIPGVNVNTGWKEPAPAKPVLVAAVAPAPAKKLTTPPAKPTTPPAKPAPKPAAPAPAAKPVASATGVPALDKAMAELTLAAIETEKHSVMAKAAAAATAAAAKKAADASTAANAASAKATMIAGEAKSALEMIEKLAKLSPGYEKVVTELKMATAKANQDAVTAKKTADAAVAASTAAAGKIAGAKAAADKALNLAQQTKAALEMLVKATAK
ncbi:hypothetical protein N8615_00455 [Verrucomicrobiales bacterium]|nr:hypothetical protein [Verrucomicrobiales bacterium]